MDAFEKKVDSCLKYNANVLQNALLLEAQWKYAKYENMSLKFCCRSKQDENM